MHHAAEKVGAASKARPIPNEGYQSFLLAAGIFVVLGVVLALFIGGYEAADQGGWITHNHNTPVWIQGDWMVGEYRICQLLTATPPAGTVMSEKARSSLPRLLCGKNDSDTTAGSFGEFENAMRDSTGSVPLWTAIWGTGDWGTEDSYFHVMPVRYFGRIQRADVIYDSWRCQRLSMGVLESAALECKALN